MNHEKLTERITAAHAKLCEILHWMEDCRESQHSEWGTDGYLVQLKKDLEIISDLILEAKHDLNEGVQ